MSYTVAWTKTALSQLDSLWTSSGDRNAITRAQDRIDLQLGKDPRHRAVVIADGLYTLDSRPIQVLFEIFEDDRLVRIEGVRLIP